MVPPHFVPLAALPLTANGKVDRRALPAPEISRGELSKPYVAPRTPTEETMASIWSAVLGVEQVGIDDNFFELGGDSILSIQVIARCRAAGLHLTPRDLFKSPTIAALARSRSARHSRSPRSDRRRLGRGSADADPALVLRARASRTPTTGTSRSCSRCLRTSMSIVLEEALQQVVLHHDALRLRFRKDGAEWQQEYGPAPASTPIVRVDLSALPDVGSRAPRSPRAPPSFRRGST